MREDTQFRKEVTRGFRNISEGDWIRGRMFQVLVAGKTALDEVMLEIGKRFAEAIMLIDREEVTGSEYFSIDPALKKWASQPESIYLGDQKVRVFHPPKPYRKEAYRRFRIALEQTAYQDAREMLLALE